MLGATQAVDWAAFAQSSNLSHEPAHTPAPAEQAPGRPPAAQAANRAEAKSRSAHEQGPSDGTDWQPPPPRRGGRNSIPGHRSGFEPVRPARIQLPASAKRNEPVPNANASRTAANQRPQTGLNQSPGNATAQLTRNPLPRQPQLVSPQAPAPATALAPGTLQHRGSATATIAGSAFPSRAGNTASISGTTVRHKP